MNKRPTHPKAGKPSEKPSARPALPKLTARHKLLLSLIGVILACVLVGGLELVLRLAHYGPDLRVFKPRMILGEKYWEFNRDISLRYFPKGMTKEPGFERFPANKSPDTYRIFSMGESSTQGDPYGPEASFSAFLREELQDIHPEKKIEVVNCGIVAISSADVIDLLPEILQQKPDAVLFYVGHNEAYGADGVLSGIRGTLTNRTYMQLRIKARNTRIGRLIQNISSKRRPAQQAAAHGFGMETMQGKVLPHQSKLHRDMLEIYRGNLQEMCDRCRRAGVDVILCTCPANVHDQSPMGSANGPSLTDSKQQEWKEALGAGRAAMQAGHIDAAVGPLEKAVQLDSSYAEARFRLARCLDPLLRPTPTDDPAAAAAARRQYQAALDEDIVHFRSCSDQTEVVREVAARNAGPHLLLVDLVSDLAAVSPEGMPGREIMTEHVHPHIKGHEVLARLICRALASSPVGSKMGDWDLSRIKAPEDYLARMGLTDEDEAVGLVITVQHKLDKWPFTPAYENEKAVSRLQGQIRDLTQNLDPIEAQVFAEIQAGRFNSGYDYGLRHQEIGRRAMAVEKPALAIQEYNRCLRFWGPMAEVQANLAQAYLMANDLAPIDSLLDVTAKLDPKLARVRFLRGMLRKAQGRIPEARTEFQTYIGLEPSTPFARAARQLLTQMGRQ